MDSVTQQLASFGIAGLLFIMWWHERQERTRSALAANGAAQHATHLADLNEHLLTVVRTNTDALAALREELRSQRVAEAEMLSRISRQLEKLVEP
jgi:hypothetical protein